VGQPGFPACTLLRIESSKGKRCVGAEFLLKLRLELLRDVFALYFFPYPAKLRCRQGTLSLLEIL